MAIDKKDFVDRMSENGGKTKKSCKEYLDLVMDAFYGFLKEGEIIRFCRIFSAETKITPERPVRNQSAAHCFVVIIVTKEKIRLSETVPHRGFLKVIAITGQSKQTVKTKFKKI